VNDHLNMTAKEGITSVSEAIRFLNESSGRAASQGRAGSDCDCDCDWACGAAHVYSAAKGEWYNLEGHHVGVGGEQTQLEGVLEDAKKGNGPFMDNPNPKKSPSVDDKSADDMTLLWQSLQQPDRRWVDVSVEINAVR
jgi:hypothetical protein